MKLRWLVAWFASFGLVASCSDDGNNPCVAGAQDCTGPETVPCQNATECPAGQVCDPLTGECSGGLPCSTHSDCGSAAFCDNGTCAPNNVGGPCDTHDNCLPGGLCADGTCSCGGALYGAENTPANVLVVLDRSDSMNDDIGGGTKWDIARQAIDDMLAAHGDSIHFGLMLYPGTNQSGTQGMTCGPGAVFVDPGPMTAGDITFFLSGAHGLRTVTRRNYFAPKPARLTASAFSTESASNSLRNASPGR